MQNEDKDLILNSDIEAIIESVVESSEDGLDTITNVDYDDKKVNITSDNYAINRICEKCINCGKCKKVCEKEANIKYDLNITHNPICTACGKCINGCLIGAITPKYSYREVKELIDKNEKVVIALVSPSIKTFLGDLFKRDMANYEYKIVTALKKLGFDYVFDSGCGADLYSLEMSTEFIDRVNKQLPLPIFTSTCPSWIKHAEIYHPEILDNISKVKTPVGSLATIIKKYFSKEKNIDESQIVVVSITSCIAEKMEIRELTENIDYSITTNELGYLLKEEDINLASLSDSNYDKFDLEGSGLSNISCLSGGISEMIVKNLYKLYTGKKISSDLPGLSDLYGNDGIKLATINIENKMIKVAVVNGISNLDKLLNSDYYKNLHIIEVLSCDNGCITCSGNVPLDRDNYDECLNKKIDLVKKLSTSKKTKVPFENQSIKKIYKEFLISPLSAECDKYIHTSYIDKSNLLK